MNKISIMEDYYKRMSTAGWEDHDTTLIPASLKIRLEDLAFLTALSKLVGRSRNEIVTSMIYGSLQDVYQEMTVEDLKKTAELANEETKILFKKHFKDREPKEHYLMYVADTYNETNEQKDLTEK